MKITISTEELDAVVKKLAIVTNKMSKMTYGVKKIVTMSSRKVVQGDRVVYPTTFTSFNGKVQVAVNLYALSGDYEEAFTINVGSEFISAVQAISKAGGETTIFIVSDNSCEIVCGDARITLTTKVEGLAPVAFDLADRTLLEGAFQVEKAAFASAFKEVAIAADNDENSPFVGVGITEDDGMLALRAISSALMAESRCPVKEGGGKPVTGLSVDSSVLKDIFGVIAGDSICIYKTVNHAVIQGEAELWQIPLLASSIPPESLDKLKGMQRDTEMVVNKSRLSVAISIALSVMAKDEKPLIVLKTDNGQLLLSNKGNTASAKAELSNLTGECTGIYLNAVLLQKTLACAKGEELLIRSGSNNTPVLIRDADENSRAVWIIAPINAR